MSRQENHQRHLHNKSMLSGRHGSEKPIFNGRPRGGGQRYTVEAQDVVLYEVRLLSMSEVYFNEGLLDEKPMSPEEKFPSVVPVVRKEFVLYEHRNGLAIPIKYMLVQSDQVEPIESVLLQANADYTVVDGDSRSDRSTQ